MYKKGERAVFRGEHAAGGAGHILREPLISDEERAPYCGMFNRNVLEEGCEVGWHQHVGDGEAYYILQGKGIYNDNGTEIPVEAGDSMWCKDGDWHSLVNTEKEDLVFIALILKSGE